MPVGFGLRHASALRVFGVNPKRYGHRICWRTHSFALRKLHQPPGIVNHQLFGLGDELLQLGLLLGRDGSLAVFVKQLIKTPLFGGSLVFPCPYPPQYGIPNAPWQAALNRVVPLDLGKQGRGQYTLVPRCAQSV